MNTEEVLQHPENAAEHVCYSDEVLAEFKNNIESKLETATRELDYLKDLEEDPTEEKEQLQQIIVRQQTFINNLTEALKRIENKTYGICRITSKLIDKERLLKVPHATLSLEAKLQVNKNAADAPVVEIPKKEKKKRSSKKEEKEPAAVQYSDDDLRNFKTLISNKIDSVNDEVKFLQVVLHDRNLGIKVENFETTSPEDVQAMIDNKTSYIKQIEDALVRIKNKSYGVCTATGQLIPKHVLLETPVLMRLVPTPDAPVFVNDNKKEDITIEASARKCRICGCTDDDCSQCIEKTGSPCYWIDVDLCSACEDEAMKQSEQQPIAISQQPLAHDLFIPSNNDNDMNFFQQLAQAAAQHVDLTMRIMQKDNKLTLNIMPGSKSVTIKPILVTGTAKELDADFFKTIAPGISEIKGIVTNIEDVKKDLQTKKPDAKPAVKKPEVKTAPEKKPAAHKPAPKKKKPVKAVSELIKPEVKDDVAEAPVNNEPETTADSPAENSTEA